MVLTKGYLVLRCGATDCFPEAIFFKAEEARDWGKAVANFNPEGYVVKEIDISSLNISDD